MTVVLDAGGIAVEIAGRRRHVEVVRERLGTTERVACSPDVRLSIEAGAPHPPDRPADATSTDAELWWDAHRLVLAWHGVVARLDGSTIAITVPSDRWEEGATFDAVDRLTQYGVAAAVAGPDRAVFHGAAIARRDRSLLVVGSSGAGKSTLAAAAWQHGWSLLGDDLVVVRRSNGRLTARGVLRPPLVPEGTVPAGSGSPVADGRRRRRLPPEVLSAAELTIAGAVVVGHHTGAGRITEIDRAERIPALLHGLAVPPVAPVLAAHLPMLAALGSRPVLRLDHGVDPDDRVARAAELLDRIGGLLDV